MVHKGGMAHRVHIVQQTVQGIAILEDGSSGSHLQSKPVPAARSESTSLRVTYLSTCHSGAAHADMPAVQPVPAKALQRLSLACWSCDLCMLLHSHVVLCRQCHISTHVHSSAERSL